ncbi:MAG: flagellar protein FliT [Porticoccus sp.]
MSDQVQPLSDQARQCRRLAHVLTLTKKMLFHADNGEWEQVTELELDRRDDLSACFSDAKSVADSVLIAEAIAALLHLNEELMAKLKIARDIVMEQGVEYSRNRSAVGSYQKIDVVR